MKIHQMGTRIFLCVLALLMCRTVCAQTQEDTIVDSANTVFRETMILPAENIPQKLLREACGIAIIPNTIKGGFVLGVRHGRGVIIGRDGNNNWQPPSFVSLTGGSVGWQVGVQATDVILVFRTRKSMESLFRNKLTLGADAAVAAGPAGRQASAATDLALQAEILSYSRSRGLFVGVALDGAVMKMDTTATNQYYGGAAPNLAALPPSSARLLATLNQFARADGSPPTAPESSAPQVPVAMAATPNNAQAVSPEMVRQQVADANRAMNALVDARWQQYLALPPEVTTPGQTVTYQTLVDTLGRYDKVAADPNFAALTQRQEFVNVRRLLQQYTTMLTTSANVQISLPQPPGLTGGTP